MNPSANNRTEHMEIDASARWPVLVFFAYGQGWLLLQLFRVLREEPWVNHRCERSQTGEQSLRLRRKVAVGVINAAQDALGLPLAIAPIQRHVPCL